VRTLKLSRISIERSIFMSKLLYIKANPKPVEQSVTFKMSEAFYTEYREFHPQDEVEILDLYKEGIKFLDGEMLGDIFGGKDNVMLKHAKKFASFDKYIIAAPMWNLGSPAILKAYFDYITYVGITFKYTAEGPMGFLANQGKKAVHIVARGGQYAEGGGANYEMGDRYIRTILGFLGITDVTTISSELTNVLQGEELQNSVNASIQKARSIAKNF
jgi:FMN-dependent NADH-azoreductase